MPEDGDIGEGSGEGEGKTAMRQVSIIISCDFKSRQFTCAICDRMPKKTPKWEDSVSIQIDQEYKSYR